MKRKHRFVKPKVTRAVLLYPETDMMQILTGSTKDDQTMVSAGIGVENYMLGDEGAGSYIEYSE